MSSIPPMAAPSVKCKVSWSSVRIEVDEDKLHESR